MAREPSTFVAPGPDKIKLRVGDRLPSLVLQLLDDENIPIDLATAKVYVMTRRRSGEPLDPWGYGWTVGKECLIIDAANAVVYYDLQPFDTVTNPGQFDLACYVRYADGTAATLPSEPTVTVELADEIRDGVASTPIDNRLFG
jgi:hypothetical protein